MITKSPCRFAVVNPRGGKITNELNKIKTLAFERVKILTEGQITVFVMQ